MLLCSNLALAVDFAQMCERDSNGDFTNSNVVNCFGFEDLNELYYGEPREGCSADAYLNSQPNGFNNKEPVSNVSMGKGGTCLYPKVDSSVSSSGGNSLKIVQSDVAPAGTGNPGGTFKPYFGKVSNLQNGKFAGFGVGGEFWIQWRYRQDQNLFKYSAKRFMVTHRQSYFEEVLIAKNNRDETGGKHAPPFDVLASYAHKGSGANAQGHGDSGDTRLKADRWHTLLMHVKMSTNTEDKQDRNFNNTPDGRPDLNNGTIEIFLDGELIMATYPETDSNGNLTNGLKVHQLDLFEPWSDNLDWQSQKDMDAFMRLDFLLFENESSRIGTRDLLGLRPEGSMWIDDVIVSTAPIPDLYGDADTIPPKAPQDLQAN